MSCGLLLLLPLLTPPQLHLVSIGSCALPKVDNFCALSSSSSTQQHRIFFLPADSHLNIHLIRSLILNIWLAVLLSSYKLLQCIKSSTSLQENSELSRASLGLRPLYSTCFHFILVAAFTSFCSPQTHSQYTLTHTHPHSHTHTHTHTIYTTRASCLIHNLCQQHIGAPIRSTGNATIFVCLHVCVCVCVSVSMCMRRHSFGHRLEPGQGPGPR